MNVKKLSQLHKKTLKILGIRLYTVGPANHEIKVGYGFAHGLTVTIVHLVLGSLFTNADKNNMVDTAHWSTTSKLQTKIIIAGIIE